MAIPTKSIAAPLMLVAALGAVFLLLRGPETAPPVLPAGAIADRILVEKAKHQLTL